MSEIGANFSENLNYSTSCPKTGGQKKISPGIISFKRNGGKKYYDAKIT